MSLVLLARKLWFFSLFEGKVFFTEGRESLCHGFYNEHPEREQFPSSSLEKIETLFLEVGSLIILVPTFCYRKLKLMEAVR